MTGDITREISHHLWESEILSYETICMHTKINNGNMSLQLERGNYFK